MVKLHSLTLPKILRGPSTDVGRENVRSAAAGGLFHTFMCRVAINHSCQVPPQAPVLVSTCHCASSPWHVLLAFSPPFLYKCKGQFHLGFTNVGPVNSDVTVPPVFLRA